MNLDARILVIDDEPEITEYLTTYLDMKGFVTVGVTNAEEGFELIDGERFLAIITDFQMPIYNGLDVVVHVRKSDLNAKTPIFVLSGALTDDVLNKFSKLGVLNAMSKPPDLEALVGILKKEGHSFENRIKKAFYDELVLEVYNSFNLTIEEYICAGVDISEQPVEEVFSEIIEYCSLVTLFGQEVSGMMSVSFASGFTREFAGKILMRPVSDDELSIFEQATGELASFLARKLSDKLLGNHNLKILASDPVIIQGKYAPVPMPVKNARVCLVAKLNDKKCFLDFTFIDMKAVSAL